VVCLNNPVVTRREFLDFLADRFQVDATAATSKPRLLHSIEQRLRAEAGLGRTCVLVIDEAQALSDALLEEVRLLANLESDTEKLLPVILSGQPELAKRLNQPHLRQLKQRIALRCSLDPLTLRETALYIAARVQFGGGKPAELFTESAIRAIYDLSGGIPRTINVVCENALLSAFAASRPRVEPDILEAVGRDFDLNFSERLHVAAATPADSADPANTIPFPPGHRWTSIPQVARRLAKRR
jgi:type II secretory pathway predicted ATPase ExeA